MATKQWEYCLLVCTPMSGLDEDGIRIAYQLVAPDGMARLEFRGEDTSPFAGIGQILNELGTEGWELVTYDTTTNRGVFKRPKT